jgi:hypothetical protein
LITGVIREQAAPLILHACEVFDRLYHFTIPSVTAHLVKSAVTAFRGYQGEPWASEYDHRPARPDGLPRRPRLFLDLANLKHAVLSVAAIA